LNNSPIGIYDSGLGGLTVWREVHRALPGEPLVYLGDGKHCPYGSRPREEIARLADRAVAALVDRGCKMIVVACNTATAAAVDTLRREWPQLPVVGLEPAIKPACMESVTRKVGVLATAHSLQGDMFHRTAARYASDVEVYTAVGEGFVELVEAGAEHTPQAEEAVRRVVEPLLERGVDRIVLGCTHYPFLRPLIELTAAGRGVGIIDSGEAVARRDSYRMRLQQKAFVCSGR